MLTYAYPPIIGGAEQHVRNLSAEFVARGHDVAVATLWHEGLAEFELDRGVRVYRIRGTIHRAARMVFSVAGRRYAPPFPDPELVLALRRVAAREQPDIVHAHNWLVRSFLPLRNWSGAALVVTLHSYGLICAKWNLMYQGAPCSGPGFKKCFGCAADHYGTAKGVPVVLGNWAMGRAERDAVDMFLAVSQAVAAGNGLVGSSLPFRVIPNFVPDDIATLRGDCKSELARLPSEDYFLFVGALTQKKGLDVLLRAYIHLTDPPPLVLIGSPWPDTPTELPRNVTVLENWRHEAVMHAWRRCLVGIVPSVWPEPCPTVALEGMATGCPIIASRIGGLPDLVVDGETGFLVPPGDAEALQQTMARLLTDSELRERMGQAGKRKVIEFQASTVVPRIEEVYRQVIQA